MATEAKETAAAAKAARKKPAAAGGLQERLEHAIAGSKIPLLGGFTTNKRIRLYDRLRRFTENKYTISDALKGARLRMEKRGDPRRVIWRRWVMGLRDGRKFSALIAPYVPPAERLMLMTGESTGKVDAGLAAAQYIAEAAGRMRGALAGALTYPAILLGLLAILMGMAGIYLLPVMESIAPVAKWPPISRHFHTFASMVRDYGLVVVLVGLAATATIIYSLPRWCVRGGEIRRWIDHKLPPYTIYREYQGASLLLGLSALMNAGTATADALSRIRSVSPPWLSWHLDRALSGLIGRGKTPSQAIDTGLLDYEVQGDVYDYDEAGSFAQAIDIVGKHIVEDTISRLKAQAASLSAVALFSVGGMLIWTYASLIFLVLEISKNTRGGF